MIHDDLEDGAELFYEERVGIPDDDLERRVKPKEELAVVAPRRVRADGPDYMPQEIAEMPEAEGISRPVDEG